MYMRGLPCGCKSGLNGMGEGSSSSSSSKSQATATTQTSQTTQISPQISPNFIQQQQPTNSAVNASTLSSPSLSASNPFVPQTGSIPGFDTPIGNALMPGSNPNVLSVTPDGIDTTTLLYGALGVMGIAIVAKMFKGRAAATPKA